MRLPGLLTVYLLTAHRSLFLCTRVGPTCSPPFLAAQKELAAQAAAIAAHLNTISQISADRDSICLEREQLKQQLTDAAAADKASALEEQDSKLKQAAAEREAAALAEAAEAFRLELESQLASLRGSLAEAASQHEKAAESASDVELAAAR